MSHEFDVVVIGGGIMGLGIAASLARETPLRVAVVEKHEPGRAGATMASGGLVRVFDASLEDTRLAAESFSSFASEPSRHGFVELGHYYRLPAAQVARFGTQFALMDRHRVPWHLLSSAEARRRVPSLRMGPDDVAVFEPRAGVADPRRSADALVTAIEQSGSVVLRRRSVHGVVERSALNEVSLGDDRIVARAVVFALGGFTPSLHALLGGEGRVYHNRLVRAAKVRWQGPALKVCVNDWQTGLYARPLDANSVLVGVPTGIEDIDPELAGGIGDQVQQRLISGAATVFGASLSASDLLDVVQAVDGQSPPGRPSVSRAGMRKRWYVARGMNGSGYKLHPAFSREVAARLLAELSS